MAATKAMSEEKKWQIEQDLRSLIEAEKIKKDSARLKAAMQLKKEKMAEMEALSKQGGK